MRLFAKAAFVAACSLSVLSSSAEVVTEDQPIEHKRTYIVPIGVGVTTTVAIKAKVINAPGMLFSLDGKQRDGQGALFVGSMNEIDGTCFLTFTLTRPLPGGVQDPNINIFLADGRSFVLVPKITDAPAGVFWLKDRQHPTAAEKLSVPNVKGEQAPAAPRKHEPKQPIETAAKDAPAPAKKPLVITGSALPPGDSEPSIPAAEDTVTLSKMMVADPQQSVPWVATTRAPQVIFETDKGAVTQVAYYQHKSKDLVIAYCVVENKADEPATFLPNDVALRLGEDAPLVPASIQPEVFAPKSTTACFMVFSRPKLVLADIQKTKLQLSSMLSHKVAEPAIAPAAAPVKSTAAVK